jgi:putative molybdopterin biosynthesis protein
MTPVQVAEYLQVHKVTVYRYIRDRELAAVRLGRALRILKSDVEEFLRLHQVAGRARGSAPARLQRREVVPARVPTPAPSPRRQEPFVPSRGESRPTREDLLVRNPFDWVARGLH